MKSRLKSRTLWIVLLQAALVKHPAVHKWVSENPDLAMQASALIFGWLRLVTRQGFKKLLPRSQYTFSVLTFMLLIGAANCAGMKVKTDTVLAAALAEHHTGPIQGCGSQPWPGFMYCQKMEGDATDQVVAFIGPPAQCTGEEPCVTFKLYYPGTTEPAYGDSIPRGQTRKEIPWKTLTKKDKFDLGDRGFWTYNYKVRWINEEGKEQESVSTGEIVLRVYKKGYVPLSEVNDDPNFVWSWVEDGSKIKMTSGLRAFVEMKQ